MYVEYLQTCGRLLEWGINQSQSSTLLSSSGEKYRKRTARQQIVCSVKQQTDCAKNLFTFEIKLL